MQFLSLILDMKFLPPRFVFVIVVLLAFFGRSVTRAAPIARILDAPLAPSGGRADPASAVAVSRASSGIVLSRSQTQDEISGQAAPLFELPKWETGAPVRLADFAGQIVVLDFFAYWCEPCKRASRELRAGLQEYYETRRGNPHGIPVRVVSINIERDHPELTGAFIRQTGLDLVLNDFEGAVMEQLGGTATPYLVILDGSRATPATPAFREAYRNHGFEGTRRLRAIIDAIKPSGAASPAAAVSGGQGEPASGPPVEHRGEVVFDMVTAEDVTVATAGIGYRGKRAGTEWRLGYARNFYEIDYRPYRPFDFLGRPAVVQRHLDGVNIGVKQRAGERLAFNAAGGFYDGFTDYRSLWLATYYAQQFGFVPGYNPPEPRGFSASGGARWEYQPTTGFADASFRYARDEIAPGYELEQNTSALLRSREILHTYAPSLKLENVLTRRIRLQNEFELRLTSGRDPRYGYRGSLNVALGERWTWRSSGGYTHEDPTLRAWFAGATIEWEFAPKWFAQVSGLYYRDTGEIENSLFISTAAPGVQTSQVGPGIRYVSERTSFSISAAPVWARYDELAVGTRPFANLYRDRDWIYVQAAFALQF